MNNSRHSDPAERSGLMRLFYRNWRPTRLGRWVNRFACWWSGLGLPPKFQAALEVHGRTSGRIRSNPVVIATVEGQRYLVSMLGPESDWVRNVEAAQGDAIIRQGRRRRVHLVAMPPEQRAPILREYVRIASAAASTSHFASARHYPTSRRSPDVTPCTGSIFHESDSTARQGRTRSVRRKVISGPLDHP
jgi:F420H(2)-dependent quinone reductase